MIDGKNILIAQVDTPQDESTGDFYYRAYSPGAGMAHCEGVYVVNLTNIHRSKEEVMAEADILILNNLCDPDLFPIIRSRKQQGKLTVYELCDDLDAVPPGSPVHAFYRHPENRLLIKKLAGYCDALQFSSPELKKKYGALNSTAWVFPNQILEVPPDRKYARRPEVIVGWGGSLGHREDMARLAAPLMDWIMSRDDVQLHLMCGDPIWELFHRLPRHRKKRTQPGSLHDYYRFLTTIDIGLAPLEDTPFNRSRSDVKYLEYAVHGVVPVVQATGPYLPVVKNGVTGFLFDTTESLTRILDGLASDVSARVGMSIAARDYVLRERLQTSHGGERIELYLSGLRRSGRRPSSPDDVKSKFERFAAIPGVERRGRHLMLASTRFELLLRGGLLASGLADKTKARGMFLEAQRLEHRNYLPHLFGSCTTHEAIECLEKALTLNPSSIKAWLLKGDEFAKQRDVPKALESYNAAAGIFPEYALPYLKSAALLRGCGLEEEALSLTKIAHDLFTRSLPKP